MIPRALQGSRPMPPLVIPPGSSSPVAGSSDARPADLAVSTRADEEARRGKKKERKEGEVGEGGREE